MSVGVDWKNFMSKGLAQRKKQANHPKMHKLQKAISILAVQKKCENPAKMLIFSNQVHFCSVYICENS
jgi:hypothetical protein